MVISNAQNQDWLESIREDGSKMALAHSPPVHFNIKMHLRGAKYFYISNEVRNSDFYGTSFLFQYWEQIKKKLSFKSDRRLSGRYQVRSSPHTPQLRRGVSARKKILYPKERKGKSCGTHKSSDRIAGCVREVTGSTPKRS